MPAVQRLAPAAVDDAASDQAQLRDALAGPDPRRLAALLRRRQVVADARLRATGGLSCLGGLDLLPRQGRVVALGDGDDPGHRAASFLRVSADHDIGNA